MGHLSKKKEEINKYRIWVKGEFYTKQCLIAKQSICKVGPESAFLGNFKVEMTARLCQDTSPYLKQCHWLEMRLLLWVKVI